MLMRTKSTPRVLKESSFLVIVELSFAMGSVEQVDRDYSVTSVLA